MNESLADLKKMVPDFKNVFQTWSLRDQSLITGEGWVVQKRGGSDIFVHEKRGAKNCAI